MTHKLFSPAVLMLVSACLIAGPTAADKEGWTTDFAAAQAKAAADDKDLLLDFTGSDWCSWCIKLNEEVFDFDRFKDYADEHFVLVELDYPNQTPQSDELKAQNKTLLERYQINAYPTILLTDAEGLPYAKTGYRPDGPAAYTEHLDTLRAIRATRDEKLAAAEQATGLDQARLLNEAMEAVGEELAVLHYEPVLRRIIALDADNQAGLNKHYTDLLLTHTQKQELMAIMPLMGENPEAAVKSLDTLLERDDLLPLVRQEVLTAKSSLLLFALKDRAGAEKLVREAIDVAPDSPMADTLRQVLEQYFADQP